MNAETRHKFDVFAVPMLVVTNYLVLLMLILLYREGFSYVGVVVIAFLAVPTVLSLFYHFLTRRVRDENFRVALDYVETEIRGNLWVITTLYFLISLGTALLVGITFGFPG